MQAPVSPGPNGGAYWVPFSSNIAISEGIAGNIRNKLTLGGVNPVIQRPRTSADTEGPLQQRTRKRVEFVGPTFSSLSLIRKVHTEKIPIGPQRAVIKDRSLTIFGTENRPQRLLHWAPIAQKS